MMREIYFDNSATTRPAKEVIDVMLDVLENKYGNPSSLHSKGIEAESILNHARESVARGLGVTPEEIVFTSGGTEANNMAIKGGVNARANKGRHIITTKIEHVSVLQTFETLEETGYNVDYLNVDSKGLVDIDELEQLLRPETIFVSIIYLNNETGTIQPVKEIGDLIKIKSPNAIFHVDAVQAFGKIEVNPKEIGAGLLTVSGHKLHGPKGIGALFVRQGNKIEPILTGGPHERKMRPGTENTPGIAGFGAAVDLFMNDLKGTYDHLTDMKTTLILLLKEVIPDVQINTPEDSGPHIVNISFPGIKGEVLVHMLEEKKIYVSTGAACSSKERKPSHVLQAMGFTNEVIEGEIRLSFSRYNTIDEVYKFIEEIGDVVSELRQIIGGN